MSSEVDATDDPAHLDPAQKAVKAWPRRVGIALLIVMVGWIYWWTASPETRGPVVEKEGSQYYNLLCRGLMKGHLYLDKQVDPYLLTAKDPWDPVARGGRGLHDASYYDHHYYIYFGITPELILFWPFHTLTGRFISESAASVLFSFGGFLFAVWLISQVRKWYFDRTPNWICVLMVLPLGLATMVPSLLRRPSVWEVPITCGYLCAMAALLCLAKALHSRRRAAWLAGASLALGLMVGARPVYLFSCAILAVPFLYWVNEYGGWRECWRDRQWWRLILAALVPIGLCGLGLAFYNYARFGKISEFGQFYQLAGDEVSKQKLFSWRYPLYGFRLYMLEPASFTAYFPYFTVITPPPGPPGHLGVEDAYGVLPNLPFAFMGLALIGTIRDREGRWRNLRTALLCMLGMAALTGVVVMSFGGVTNRYMVDFTPSFMLLAAAGMLFLFSRPWARGVRRWLMATLTLGLLIYSVAFDICVSIGHNNLMRTEQPFEYGAVAYAGNQLSNAWDHLTGTKYGPIEMKVIFPSGKEGQVEALMATGTSFWSDYLYVIYDTPTTLRFGLEHTSRGSIVSKPVEYIPDKVQTLRIDMGSLYPPPSHPFFDRFPPSQVHLLQHLLRVELNGENAMEALTEFYDASSRIPSIGNSGTRAAFTHAFSGKIVSWSRLADALPTPPPEEFGPVKLLLRFPAFSGERSEPLVCTGRPGLGDLIYVHYINDHQLSFGHDNWGDGARNSEPITVDYKSDHVLEVDFGALYPSAGHPGWTGPSLENRTIIKLDGKTVFDAVGPVHPSAPFDVRLATNSIGASSAYPTFTGILTHADRLSHSLSDK